MSESQQEQPDRPPAPEEAAEQPLLNMAALHGGARAAIEAVLMVIDEPIEESELAAALDLPVAEVTSIMETLASEYAESQRGFMLRRLGGRWRIYSRPEYAPVVEKFLM